MKRKSKKRKSHKRSYTKRKRQGVHLMNTEEFKEITYGIRHTLKYGKKLIELKNQTGGNQQVFHFFCGHHYGDHIFNLKLFYNITQILKEKCIKIEYYYDPGRSTNKIELERYIDSSVVSLHNISDKPENAIELHGGAHSFENVEGSDMFVYVNAYYKKIINMLGIEDLNINTSILQNEDYLLDVYTKLDAKFHNADILVLNVPSRSGQFPGYDQQKMDALAERLSTKYKVVVLNPVKELPSTVKDGLQLQDIGAISTHLKYIFGMNSGPLIPCLNIHTYKSVKKWIIFDNINSRFKDATYTLPVVIADNINSADKYIE